MSAQQRERLAILFVNKVSPEVGGGAERRLLQIAQGLARRGHRVHVLCGITEGDQAPREEFDGVHIERILTLPRWVFRWRRVAFFASRLSFYVSCGWHIWHAIDRHRIDVVMDDISPVPSAAYVVSRMKGVPCCATIHEPVSLTWFRFKGVFTTLFVIFSRIPLPLFRYDHVVVDSAVNKRRLQNAMKNLSLVPLGVDRSLLEVTLSNDNSSDIVSVGRLMPHKGHAVLIDAMKSVVATMPSAKLVIVGDGPQRAELERQVRAASLENHVALTGRVGGEELLRIMSSSALFALASFEEGFGMAPLEAMAMGLPVVLTDLPALAEFVKDSENGFLVRKGDADGFASAICTLLRDKKLQRRMSARNRQAAATFEWDRTVDAMERIFCEAVAQRRGEELQHHGD